MCRALEAHFSFYLAFYKLYMTRFFDDNQEIENELKDAVMNAISDLSDYVHKGKKDHVKHNHEYLLDAVRSIKLSALKDAFDKSLKNRTKFYRIYMELFEAILLLIRGTREQLWELHLYSLQQLYICIFSHSG